MKSGTKIIVTLSVLLSNSCLTIICHADKQIDEDSYITIFSHGFGASKFQADYYCQYTNSRDDYARCTSCDMPIQGCCFTFNYSDVGKHQKTCLGQEADMKMLHDALLKNAGKKISLFGVSRGAVTIANCAGSGLLTANVSDITLESPFADITDVVRHKTGFASLTSCMPLLFPCHDPNGIQPIKVAEHVDKNIPILIICSKQDDLIPWQSSARYYEALRKTGHEKVHLLVLDRGTHANLFFADGYIARDVMHAFKKQYGLPHNSEWAAAGQKRFEQCQPSVGGDSCNALTKKQGWLSSLFK